MRRAAIHIGSGKTGSSSIQYALSKMSSPNICYPMVEGTGHQKIEVLFRSKENTSRGIRSTFKNDYNGYKEYSKEFKHKFKNALKLNQNTIISSEFLFWFSHEEITMLLNFLKDCGIEEFGIYVYLREPASYYLSLVQQLFKASSTLPNPHEFECKYKKAIQNWMSVFGKNAIHVREFSKEKLSSNDVVTDFSKSISSFFNTNITLNGSKINESMSSEAMVLMQQYRNIHKKNDDGVIDTDSNKLFRLLHNVDIGSKPVLKKHVADIINQKNIEDINYVQQHFRIFENINKGGGYCSNTSDSYEDVQDILEEVDETIIKDIISIVDNRSTFKLS